MASASNGWRTLAAVLVATVGFMGACGDSDDAVPEIGASTSASTTSISTTEPASTSETTRPAAPVPDTAILEIDMSTGWVSSEVDLQGELAAHPDLGVVLVGDIGEWPPQSPPAWYSPDGVTFEEVPFPAPTGDPIGARDVAANGDGFVTILFNSMFASFSSDGRTWEPIDLSGLVGGCGLGVVDEDASTDGTNCDLVGVAAGPSGFVILGVDDERCVGFAVHSADGRQWESTDFPQNCSLIGAASTNEGFIALGAPNMVVSSADGVSWNVVSASGLPELTDRGLWEFNASGETLALVGSRSGPNCDYLPGTWHSTDSGRTWFEGTIEPVGEPAPDDAGFQPEDIEVTEFGFVAVGPLVSDPLCRPAVEPDDSGLILISGDGVNWRQFTNEFAFRNIAVTSTGLIGSGTLGIATWTPAD